MTIENHFPHDNQEGDYPGLMFTTQTADPSIPGANRAVLYIKRSTNDVKIRLDDGTYIYLAHTGSGSAPDDAKYIVQETNASLANAQSLGALSPATGLLVNTVTTSIGVLTSINTSAALASVVTDETGSGALVFGTNPTLAATRITGLSDTQQEIVKGYSTQTSNLVEYQNSSGTVNGSITNTGIITFKSFVANGTAGAGYLELANQSSNPGTPTSASRVFIDSSNRFSWVGTNTYVRTFDGTANSADRIYILPNQAGTVLLATYTGNVASIGTHTITGSSDNVQFTILANSTNTSDLVQFQTSGGIVKTRFAADGRIALYGATFTDDFSLIQTSGASLNIPGSSTSYTMHLLVPTVTVTTANETGTLASISAGLRVNQSGFTVSAVNGASFSVNTIGATGSVTVARAVNVQVVNTAAATLVTGVGYGVSNPSNSGGGTYTGFAGVNVVALTGATNNTAILVGTATIAIGNFTFDANSSTYNSRFGAQVLITGSSDQSQLVVKGNSTQTTVTVDIQTSGGSSVFSITNGGVTTTTGGFVGPIWAPASDSTSALKITKADGTTAILTVDTTNSTIGLGTSPTTTARITTSYSPADPAAQNVAHNIIFSPTFTADNAVALFGISSAVTVNANGFNITGAIRAQNNTVTINGATGTVSVATGSSVQVINTGAGTLTQGNGYSVANGTNSGGGTYTKLVGMVMANLTAATNNTFILGGTTTAATGNFGFDFNSVTYASRLGAQLSIAGSSDQTQLIVKGFSTQTNVTFSVQNSSGTAQFTVGNTGNTTWSDGANLAFGTSTGTKIGTATTQKIAFFNSSPIVQPINTVAIDTLLVNLGLRASGGVALFDTDVKIGVVGKGLYIKEGTNATMGTGTLSGGTATISTTKVTASSRIFLTDVGGGILANLGSLYVDTSSTVAGTSFVVKSTNTLDSSNFNWFIIEPA